MSVDEIIDELYALPPEQFTHARNEAERDLRKAGELTQAAHVRAQRKPNAAASAVNRLVRRYRREVEAFLETAARVRDAQVAGKGDLPSAVRGEREALEKLVALGGEAVRGTLQAAAVDDEAAAKLLQARLVVGLEPAGFGTLLSYAAGAAERGPVAKPATARARGAKKGVKASPAKARAPRTRTTPPPRPDDTSARAQLKEAERALAVATQEEREARSRWTDATRKLEAAEVAVEKAKREIDLLQGA